MRQWCSFEPCRGSTLTNLKFAIALTNLNLPIFKVILYIKYNYSACQLNFIYSFKLGTTMMQYLNHKTSQNPHVLVLGDKDNSSQVFIIFNREEMEQETLLQAVDLCFKHFFVYNINYPKPSALICEFLQHTIFNIPGGVSV